MPDFGTYHIRLQGQVEVSEINRMSPLQMTLEASENEAPSDKVSVDGTYVDETSAEKLSADKVSADKMSEGTATQFTVCTDQAGVVGLLRHLHGLGLMFLSIRRGDEGSFEI